MPANLIYNAERARAAADLLLPAFRTTGIFGQAGMPEDSLPEGITAGDEAHLRFITLTVAIDYQRDADQLWDAARQTYASPQTRYLFDPAAVDAAPRSRLIRDMQLYRLSRKEENDPGTWQTICTTLLTRFGGQVSTLLEAADYDALRLLELIRSPRYRSGFPFLKGPKIASLWVRMLHDNCHVQLRRLADVPLPIDVHTAQASLQVGAVQAEEWSGPMEGPRTAAQAAWREALQGSADYPLRLDEPLWLLSRNGCRKTETWPCQFRDRCPVAGLCDPRGPVINIRGAEITDQNECRITFRPST